MANNIVIQDLNGQLLVDSRLIAERLGIQHEALLRTINKYLNELQQFGHIRFENGTVTNSVGARNTVKFVYLNEDQATLLMTMSRNTAQVLQCKVELVTAFKNAKELINELPMVRQLPPVRDTIEYLAAAKEIRNFPDPILRSLLNQRLMEDLSAGQPLLNGVAPTQVILTIRAKDLGYSDKQIGSGSQLGKFVAKILEPNGKTQHGKYPVNCYDLTPELDETIHAFFR